jgi:hypothetical protein
LNEPPPPSSTVAVAAIQTSVEMAVLSMAEIADFTTFLFFGVGANVDDLRGEI